MAWKLKLRTRQLSWKTILTVLGRKKERVERARSPQQAQDASFVLSAPNEEAPSARSEESLPDEILQRIFEKLNGRSHDMLRCMQVSRRWRSIMKLAVQSVYLKDDLIPRLEGVARQLEEFENLSTLKIAIFNGQGRPWAEFFRVVGGTCKRLKQVTILCQFSMLLPDDIASLFCNICGLEKLRLNGDIPLSSPLLNTHPFTALDSFCINDNPSLKEVLNLSEATPNLRRFELVDCSNLEHFPDLSGLASLTILHIENCSRVTGMPSLSAIKSLQVLEITDCTGLVCLPSIAELTALVVLKLRGCTSLNEVQGLTDIPPNMERLILYDCPKLPPISTSSIRRLKHLKDLALGHLDPLDGTDSGISNPFDPGPSSRTIRGSLDGLDQLQMFALDSDQEQIPPLGYLPRLLHLRFRFIRASELPPMASPPSPLLSAMLFGCTSLQSIEPLMCFPTLEQLTLKGCHSLHSLPLLGTHFRCLRDLVVADCPLLNSLPDLSGLSALSLLTVDENDALKSIPDLSGLKNLRKLSIKLCPLLQRLPPLTDLPSLLSLAVHQCSSLGQVPACLSTLSSLEALEVSDCPVKQIPPLSGLPHLRSICLRGCSELSQLPPLTGLSRLQTLNLSYCSRVRVLPALDGLTALEELDLQCCTSLMDIPPLTDASKSLVIKLEGCTSLRKKDRILAGGHGHVDWGSGRLVPRGLSGPSEGVSSSQA